MQQQAKSNGLIKGNKMIKAIGGRKLLVVYLIMITIVVTYWYMVYKGQIQPGDFSTFCTSLVTLGIGYGVVNAGHKLAAKKE